MAKLAPTSSKSLQRIDSVRLAERSLSRVEVAALKRIDAIRDRSLGSVVDVPIKKRDYSHLRGGGEEELTSFFETEIGKASSEKEVRSLVHDFEDLSAELEVDLPVELEDPHGTGLQVESYETSLGDIPEVTGYLRRTLGLNSSAASRTLTVKEEELQTDLNKALGSLLKIIQTEDPVDAFVGNDESGNPRIHTLTVYRRVDEQLIPEHYNLTDESELVRLLIDNVEAAGGEFSEEQALERIGLYREALVDVAKELDRVSNEVSPRIGKGANYSMSSIGNINGASPLAQIGPRAGGILQDPNFMKNTVKKMLSDPKYGMVDSNGKLNERGRKTLKEIAAASKLIDNEQARLQQRLSSLNTRRKEIEEDPSRDRLEDQAALAKITTEMDALQKQIAELGQAAKASAAISILQLNREASLVGGDGSVIGTVSLRDALRIADNQFVNVDMDFEADSVGEKLRGLPKDLQVVLVRQNGSEEIKTVKEALEIAGNPDQVSQYKSLRSRHAGIRMRDQAAFNIDDPGKAFKPFGSLSSDTQVTLVKKDGTKVVKTLAEIAVFAKIKKDPKAFEQNPSRYDSSVTWDASTIAAKVQEAKSYSEFTSVIVDQNYGLGDKAKLRQTFGLRMQKDFEGFMIDQNTSWYQTKPGETRFYKPFAPDAVKLEENRAGFELGNVLFYRGATSAKKSDPSFRILNQLRHEDRSIPLGQEISGLNWVLPAAEALIESETADGLAATIKAYKSDISEEAVATTYSNLNGLPDFLGMTPEAAVKELRKNAMIPDYRGWFRRKINSDV